MEQLAGRTALVTGASGGIGRGIALRLAEEGVDLILGGRRADALEALADEVRAGGVRAAPLIADLEDPGRVEGLIAEAEAALGPIDILVNNAGIEEVSQFTAAPPERLRAMIDLNLTAPMLLTRQALPGMEERGRGHVVFISSVAGKAGTACNEPYAASKAGLILLNQSLRAEYRDSPIGFSVVCPGFVAGDGMYQRMLDEGLRSNPLIGRTSIARVSGKVVDAIRRDRPEVVESGSPIRPLLALSQLSPRFGEWVAERIGGNAFFRRAAAKRGRVA